MPVEPACTNTRDYQRYPVALRDRRNIYWELRRTHIPPIAAEGPELAGLEAPGSRAWVARVLSAQNGIISPFNAPFMGLVPGNEAAWCLGSAAQARASLWYLLDYLTKDSNPLTNAAAALVLARAHLEHHPSIAADTGTEHRTALHLLQRTLNSVAGYMEVAGTQAAALVLGYPGELSSHGFVSLYAYAALSYVVRHNQTERSGKGVITNHERSNTETNKEQHSDTEHYISTAGANSTDAAWDEFIATVNETQSATLPSEETVPRA